MADVIWTRAVERDLVEIGDTIALDSPWLAVAFVDDIHRHCSLLASSPQMGRPRPDIGSALSFPHRRYIVFYRYLEQFDRVEILRVWHGRRRPPRAADLGLAETGSGD